MGISCIAWCDRGTQTMPQADAACSLGFLAEICACDTWILMAWGGAETAVWADDNCCWLAVVDNKSCIFVCVI